MNLTNIDEIIDYWIETSNIPVEAIPCIAEEYLNNVVNKPNNNLIKTIIDSGAFQMMDWNKALKDICKKRNITYYNVYDKDGNFVIRYK